MTVLVVGGGVSGLAAAWEARRNGEDVVLVEASATLGGKLATTQLDRALVELGPDSFLTRNPEAMEVIDELDLELVAPSAQRALLYSRGARRTIPGGLVLGAPPNLGLALHSELVGPLARVRAAFGVLARSRRGHETDDLGRLARWRWGTAWTMAHIEPLVGGINANTIDGLSARVSAPSILDLPPSGPPPPRGGPPPRPPFLAPREGTSRLAEALAALLAAWGVRLRTREPAISLAVEGGRVRLETEHETLWGDTAIVAVPAWRAARLLAASAPRASELLAAIRYASVVVLAAGVPAHSIPASFHGVAGVLVDRREGLMTTAVSLASHKWPHWSPEGAELLRISAGNLHDVRPFDRRDEDLVEDLVAEAGGILGVALEPNATRLARWPQAFPHFAPWHTDLVARIDGAVSTSLGDAVQLAGAWRAGSGIPTCIAFGRAAARRGLQAIGRIARD